jgi:very-short-patch-repair endonuclease
MEMTRMTRWMMTDAELLLWTRLRDRQLGVAFDCHVPVGPYVVDFVCFERRLVVELAGNTFVASDEDRERDAWLAENGFRVRRFREHEVLLRPEAVIAALWLATEDGAADPVSCGGRIGSRRGRVRRPPVPRSSAAAVPRSRCA